MKITACIPARYQSSRLPGKPLLPLCGKPMIEWVYERVSNHPWIDHTIVLTDDQRILDWADENAVNAIITSQRAQNGTERIGEVLGRIDNDIILNIQGDEPAISTTKLNALIETIQRPKVEIATLCAPIKTKDSLFDYNKVKVVVSNTGRALYFSRQAIPAQRDFSHHQWVTHHQYYLHLGVYAFKKNVFKNLIILPPSKMEKLEKLEQLRWLENDYDITVTQVEDDGSFGVDTEEDLLAMQEFLNNHNRN